MIEQIDYKVQTTRGDRSIHELTIGEMIYDRQGKAHPLQRIIENNEMELICEVSYSDGRKADFLIKEPIYLGGGESSTCDQLLQRYVDQVKEMQKKEMVFGNLEAVPVEYEDGLRTMQRPDPYIAGALLIYGDYESEIVKLPLEYFYISNLLKVQHQFDYLDPKLRWDELFQNRPRIVTKRIEDRVIPIEYLKGSMNDRWQMIRAIFDTGYDKNWTPDKLSLMHDDRWRLTAVQELLWSMGIYSTLYHKSNERPLFKEYRLDVHYSYKDYARFFYKVSDMEHHLIKEQQLNRRAPEYRHSISAIRPLIRGFHKRLLFREQILYLTDDFIPRISV